MLTNNIYCKVTSLVENFSLSLSRSFNMIFKKTEPQLLLVEVDTCSMSCIFKPAKIYAPFTLSLEELPRAGEVLDSICGSEAGFLGFTLGKCRL